MTSYANEATDLADDSSVHLRHQAIATRQADARGVVTVTMAGVHCDVNTVQNALGKHRTYRLLCE